MNRSLPDAQLAPFVDALLRRIAGFEKHAVAGSKAFVDEVSLPPDTVKACFTSVQQPGTRARASSLLERGLQTRSEAEMTLGSAVAKT